MDSIPFSHFKWNELQYLAAIGIDPRYAYFEGDPTGIGLEWCALALLDELFPLLQDLVLVTLIQDGWDWDLYPNPLILFGANPNHEPQTDYDPALPLPVYLN